MPSLPLQSLPRRTLPLLPSGSNITSPKSGRHGRSKGISTRIKQALVLVCVFGFITTFFTFNRLSGTPDNDAHESLTQRNHGPGVNTVGTTTTPVGSSSSSSSSSSSTSDHASIPTGLSRAQRRAKLNEWFENKRRSQGHGSTATTSESQSVSIAQHTTGVVPHSTLTPKQEFKEALKKWEVMRAKQAAERGRQETQTPTLTPTTTTSTTSTSTPTITTTTSTTTTTSRSGSTRVRATQTASPTTSSIPAGRSSTSTSTSSSDAIPTPTKKGSSNARNDDDDNDNDDDDDNGDQRGDDELQTDVIVKRIRVTPLPRDSNDDGQMDTVGDASAPVWAQEEEEERTGSIKDTKHGKTLFANKKKTVTRQSNPTPTPVATIDDSGEHPGFEEEASISTSSQSSDGPSNSDHHGGAVRYTTYGMWGENSVNIHPKGQHDDNWDQHSSSSSSSSSGEPTTSSWNYEDYEWPAPSPEPKIDYWAGCGPLTCIRDKELCSGKTLASLLPKGRPPCCNYFQFRMLRSVKDLLNRVHFDWFIAFGTLLGSFRDESIMPWTADVDIAVKKAHLQKLGRDRVRQKFRSHGYDIFPTHWDDDGKIILLRMCYTANHTLVKQYPDTPNKTMEDPEAEWLYEHHYPYMDIYEYSTVQGQYDGEMVKVFTDTCNIWKDIFFPLVQLKIYNESFPSPNNSQLWLRTEYGATFMTPIDDLHGSSDETDCEYAFYRGKPPEPEYYNDDPFKTDYDWGEGTTQVYADVNDVMSTWKQQREQIENEEGSRLSALAREEAPLPPASSTLTSLDSMDNPYISWEQRQQHQQQSAQLEQQQQQQQQQQRQAEEQRRRQYQQQQRPRPRQPAYEDDDDIDEEEDVELKYGEVIRSRPSNVRYPGRGEEDDDEGFDDDD